MLIPFNYLDQEFKDNKNIIRKWKKLISSTDYTLGRYVSEVEMKFANYFNVKHVIAVNSGTDALILALRALKVGVGDEVITAANTFYATAGAIVAVGAKPILVDVNENYQIDENSIEKKITKKTRVIIPVYWGGGIPEIKKILRIAKKYDLRVVEDACMAIGGKIQNTHPGTFGDIGCFSFHPLKTINAIGDAGMICTNNSKIYKWILKYRNHGMSSRDKIDIWGVNMRMQPLQCVVVLEGLKKIDKIIKKRNDNAKFLDKRLSSLSDFISLPKRNIKNIETFALYMMRVKYRDKLKKYLNSKKIEAKIHYPTPLCLQVPYLKFNDKDSFGNAIKQSQELLTLPIHQYIKKKQLEYIFLNIKNFYSKI